MADLSHIKDLGDLPLFEYDLIMADPPWDFENWSEKGEQKNAKAKYKCMELKDICALPVGNLARGDAVLLLWVTNPLIFEQRKVLDAWGFRYAGLITWHKKTVNGTTAFGTGYNLRCASEHMIMGFTGKPHTSKAHRTIIEGPVREHSRKPDEAFAWAETYLKTPKKPKRIEIFSRQNRDGWDCWGNEVTKFSDEDQSKSVKTPEPKLAPTTEHVGALL